MKNDGYTKGRGAQTNTPNRFLKHWPEQMHIEAIDDWEKEKKATEYFYEDGATILNKINSPDVPLAYSLNPYQGCEHGCVYCYARPTHEYWGYSAGEDFEQKIIIKHKAAQLLRQTFGSKKWKPMPISLSGNTDPYQPAERKTKISRQLLEVCLEYKNPVGIITKNSLILRDLDLLQELNKEKLVSVYISITSMDENLRRKLEPRTTTYKERIQALEKLSEVGIHTGVMNAPIIPGLNDAHMYEVLRQASMAGAKSAGYTLVRLNGAVEDIFTHWLQHTYPERSNKILNSIMDTHGGSLSDSRFGTRMKGEGNFAEIMNQQFHLYCRQFKLNEEKFEFNTSGFVRHKPGQMSLF